MSASKRHRADEGAERNEGLGGGCTCGCHDPRADDLLTLEQLAEWLQRPKATLYAWRTRGLGPRGIKVGNVVRYRRRDVNAYLDANTDDQEHRGS